MKRIMLLSSRREAKAQLRPLLSYIKGFQVAAVPSKIEEARTLLQSEPPFHFVFIGGEFPETEAAAFIAEAKKKKLPSGDKTVFVLLLGSATDSDRVASNMMAGFHGFLCEPYSLESVTELTQLAGKVSEQHTVVRMKAATGILLSDLRDEDPASKAEPEGKNLWEKSQQSCKWYNSVTNDSLTQVMTKLKGATLSDCWIGVKKLREKAQNSGKLGNHLRVFFKKAVPPRRRGKS